VVWASVDWKKKSDEEAKKEQGKGLMEKNYLL
jgi:hypothetical protein